MLAGFISFVFIESPFKRKESAVSRRLVYGCGIAASIVSITLGFVIYWYQGFPQRYDETTRQIVMKNSNRKSDYGDTCGNFRTPVHTTADLNLCIIGSDTSHDVLFWGDSHVQQLLPLVKNMHAAGKLPAKGIIFAIEAGCPPTEHLNNVGKHFHCDTFARLAMNLAEQDGIGTVFIGFSTWWALRDYQLCLSGEWSMSEKIA